MRGISFAVERGEVFALLGPNGAGKSTTVRILTTLSAASAGTARVAGFDVATEPGEVRRRIGYIAQASGVDIYATGRENVVLQGRFHGLSSADSKARTAELLGAFKLEEAADRLVRTYSGGMKRRLDVAMGLINRPEVLFLDEPTTGLDPEEPRRPVGRSRAAGARRAHHPAHHPLPRRGRPAGPSRGDHRPREDRRRGHARVAEGEPARRSRQDRAGGGRSGGASADVARGSARSRLGAPRRNDALRPGRERGAGDSVDCRRARSAGA